MFSLPDDIIDYIMTFENPYKSYFKKEVLIYFKTQERYNAVMRQLRSYVLHDRQGGIRLAVDALLSWTIMSEALNIYN